jgi:hypothetical protein
MSMPKNNRMVCFAFFLTFLSGCGGAVQLGCPSNNDAFADAGAASYVVVVGVQQAGGISYSALGTAFAVDDRLLATNAHVTEALRDLGGLAVSEIVGVQAGTGEVVTCLRALTHPDYNGDPLASQDIGLITTSEQMSSTLPLNLAPTLELGGEILLSGFPGNVNDIFEVVPGTTVPQATSLTGEISALRSYDTTAIVTQENLDFIQHQLPTSPGTSGSAMVQCGQVVAVNNAGTNKLTLVVQPDGSVSAERIESASNNFGVHVKYLEEMISLFDSNAIQGFELPTSGGTTGIAGTYTSSVATPLNPHTFTIAITSAGIVSGTSSWQNTGNFQLSGSVDASGNFVMTDNAGFDGTYAGTLDASTGVISGDYFESGQFFANWTANRQ